MLIELHKLFQSEENDKVIREFLKNQRVDWKFIPSRSTHFVGLWEAAVKSFKHHLYRTVGGTLLTFEQLETFIIETEVIMNSRPLSPMSPDPNDLQPLTPGNFLIGGPLTSFPQMDLIDVPPLQWKLGRIVATQPGPDGIIRLAIVKTDTEEYKRCIKKLCPLPIESFSHAHQEEKKHSP